MMVGLYFAASVINNHALKYGIPMPLHMIFKAVSARDPGEREPRIIPGRVTVDRLSCYALWAGLFQRPGINSETAAT